jgi:hypothetical protein
MACDVLICLKNPPAPLPERAGAAIVNGDAPPLSVIGRRVRTNRAARQTALHLKGVTHAGRLPAEIPGAGSSPIEP